jgi:broad specificity phosphatase PhoE
MYALYVTHPQVRINPAVPVPQWELSDLGAARARAFAAHPLARAVTAIHSSGETKAIELAHALAAVSGAGVTTDPGLGENDRSATGYVPQDRFEQLADAFFGHPDDSVSGWETARAAQDRIVAAFERALAGHDAARPIAFAGHGGVGTLLKCHLAGRAISRDEDQRRRADPGGGNVLVIRLADRKLFGDWTPMEQLPTALSD